MEKINNTDKEQMLLTGKSLDELINLKIQQEYEESRKKAQESKQIKKFTQINETPQNLIFSKNAVFKVFNKKTAAESLINGIQAEGLLGLQEQTKNALLQGKIKTFISGDLFVEFDYAQNSI